jgi:uncharacterized protein YkwD
MKPLPLLLSAGLLVLAACETPTTTTLGDGTTGVAKVFRINGRKAQQVPYRMLDSINALREAAGAPPLSLDPKLTAAAKTHANDMMTQNRPWHFGSDGSSPLQRVQRTGYTGAMLGETISETFESDIETLAAWMEQRDTRNVILDKRATHLGIGWAQEPNGKLWWTLVMGG